jgi:hypothetical protein
MDNGSLTCYVVTGDGPCLTGIRRLAQTHPSQLERDRSDHPIETSQTRLKSLLDKYSDIFKNELGTMNSIRAELLVKENASPRFLHPRSVQFVLNEAIERGNTKARKIGYPQESQLLRMGGSNNYCLHTQERWECEVIWGLI